MTELDITLATDDDVDQILPLLKEEYDADDGFGFYGNRNMIRRSVGEDLWVARYDGQLAGFLLGKYAPDILWIVPAYRGRQVGTALFATSLQRAFDDNVNAMDIECTPPTSYGFWAKQGFERYGPSEPWDTIYARRVSGRTLSMPGGLEPIPVSVSFFPERVLYGEGATAISVTEVTGGNDKDGVTWLPHRVLALSASAGEGDLVVKILVAGKELYFGKAKYEKPKALGVVHDWRGSTFYIDKILPVGADQ